jgi:hypothetical protein
MRYLIRGFKSFLQLSFSKSVAQLLVDIHYILLRHAPYFTSIHYNRFQNGFYLLFFYILLTVLELKIYCKVQ